MLTKHNPPVVVQKVYHPLPPKGWGTRHTLTLLGFCALSSNYAMRFNLSMAIVAMVKTNEGLQNDTSPSYIEHHVPCSHLISHESANSSSSQEILLEDDELAGGETFEWSEIEQGVLLGSFFWGYFMTQIPGGILAQIYGGKLLIGYGLGLTALLTLITPFVARLGLVWLIIVRVIEGLAEGVVIPSMQVLLAKWLPPDERSKLSTFVYSGISIGAAITMLFSGLIIKYLSWPFVFYGIGLITLIWLALWMKLIFETPLTHPSITKEELEYLKSSISWITDNPADSSTNHKGKKSTRPPTPWRKILTSFPVIAIYVAATSNAWGLYTLLIEIPTYMKNVLHFNIQENSFLSAMPHLCMFVIATTVTSLTDYLIQKKNVPVLKMRKLCNSIAQWGTAVALIGTGLSGCNRIVTVICLNLSVGFIGAGFGGFLVNSIDIASNYVGIIMGIANAFANVMGFVAPSVAGLLLSSNQSVQQWSLVFFIAAGFLIFGNTFYIMFAQSDELEWNRIEEDEEEEDVGIVITVKRRYSTLSLGLPQSS